MMNSSRQPGLDGRHGDQNGQISEKHRDTGVSTLRVCTG